MRYYVYYLIIINIMTFIIYGVDKWLAIKHLRRVKEHTLYLLSIIGGSLGAIGGMLVFRHKTLKIKFYLINIISMIIWGYVNIKYIL